MRYTSRFWRWFASGFLAISVCGVNPAAAIPGDPDPDFGSGGAVVMDVSADNLGDNARKVAVQCDGRIVVTGDSGYTVARFNVDGTPDADFGTAGFVLLTVNGETVSGHMSVIQHDGKIVVFGEGWNTGDPVAVRLNSDGSTDTTYGNNGVVSLDVDSGDENLWASALQADGKILVASNSRFLVLRLSKDGALDPSFGNGGVATRAGPGFNAITLQVDGKIVGVGGFSGPFMVTRLNNDGSLDTSFDVDGVATTDALGVFGTPSGVAVRSDGKIVVGGYGGVTGSPDPYREIILLRFGSNGALDTTFGSDGNGIVATNVAPADDEIYDLVLDPQERIIVAGQSEDYISSNLVVSVLVSRYTANGVPDSTFGTNGAVVSDGSTAWALALQTDGKIVIGGYRGETTRQLLVQRFLNDSASAGVVPGYCQVSSGSGGSSGGNNNSGGGGGGSIDLFSLAFAIGMLTMGGVRRRRSRQD